MKSLFVAGHPVSQPRPRRGRNGHFYANNQRSAAWRRQVAWAVKQELGAGFEGPVFLWLHFAMPVPESLSAPKRAALVGKPHTSKPDLDNLTKAVVDAIVTAGVVVDDRLITSMQASKRYALEPGVQIVLAEAGEPPRDEFTAGIGGES